MKSNLLIVMVALMLPVMGVSGAHAKSRASAVAHAMWQTQDEWYVESGRYVSGRVPSYQGQTHYQGRSLYLAARETWHGNWAIERSTSANIHSEGYFTTDRETLVRVI